MKDNQKKFQDAYFIKIETSLTEGDNNLKIVRSIKKEKQNANLYENSSVSSLEDSELAKPVSSNMSNNNTNNKIP